MAQFNINPIQWHEGMLLMPQHFQQADMRVEGLLTYYMSRVFPFFWGVSQLKIDEALLTAGTFRPLTLEAILPDGLLITAPSPDLQINLQPFQAQLQTAPNFIYLCIPYLTEDLSGDLPRYHSNLNPQIVDMNTGDQPIDIPRLSPNLSLQVGQEPPAHYISMPIAQVSYDTKSFFLTAYIPPTLQATTLSEAWQMCNKLAVDVRGKLNYLQQKVQAVGDQLTIEAFFEKIEESRLKLIAGLLPMEAVLSTGNAHPFEIYKTLCTLAAQISGIKYGEIPPQFGGYNHLDIAKSFSQVIDYIQRVLGEIEESYTVLPFTLNERAFTLQLQSSWSIDGKLILGTQIQVGVEEHTLIDWINNCVIVTDKYITLAKDNRVLGAARQIISSVPSLNLVPSQGIQLLSVELDERYIDPTGVLCLFNVSDDDTTRPAEVVLYSQTS